MATEVLDALMDVFNSANCRPLTLEEVTRRLRLKGIYQDVELPTAMGRVISHLNYDRASATYPFCEIGKFEWGLESWLRKQEGRARGRVLAAAEPLHVGWETQHTLSPSSFEIESGTFPLRGQISNRFIASMDEQQREHSIVELRCYGSEKLICAMTYDDRDNWILEGMALQCWYKENGVEPGDIVRLTVEEVNPLALRIYTEWDRDADAYRRYEQQRNLDVLPSIDLPIRDLIWLHFRRTQKVAHRSEVARSILAERPEISERSVDACLSANPHLFVRVGEGNWGLKEWGIEDVVMLVRPRGDDPMKDMIANGPTVIVPLDYVLANIAAEDLVYRILRSAKTSLSDAQITERIVKYLGVDRNILARTSFLDPKDSRLIRLHNGTFALREDLEKVISELTMREHEIEQSLGRANEEVGRLKDELASTVARYEQDVQRARAETAQLRQLERERDEARRVALVWFRRYSQLAKKWSAGRVQINRVLPKFLRLIGLHIGFPALQNILDTLRDELESLHVEEESK